MNFKVNIFFILFLVLSFCSTSQNIDFKTPNNIPNNVREYSRGKFLELIKFTDATKMIVRYEMSLDSVFFIEFYPNELVVYYDAINSMVLRVDSTNVKIKTRCKTSKIPLGWFRQYSNFYGDWEQPYHEICIAESGYYSEFNLKQVRWGYSSHHFELDIWQDCYGKYTHTTQVVSLGVLDNCGDNNCIRWCNFPNEQSNYTGYYFENTNIPVDNNATYYQVDFHIDFEPTRILGSNIVCANEQATFTLINNSYKNRSVVWSKSSNLTYVSGQGSNNYVVTPNNSGGKAWVKATYRTTCGDMQKQFDFWIGEPSFSISGTDELMRRQPGMAVIQYSKNSAFQEISNVNWSYTGPLEYINGDVSKARYRVGNSSGLGFIYAIATNTCGQKENRMFYEVSDFYKIYPNPVDDFLTIEINKNKIFDYSKSEIIQIRLYDKMMVLQKRKVFENNSVTIGVSDLRPDVYILQIIVGDNIFEEKIIISR